jgi:hypothetical protein
MKTAHNRVEKVIQYMLIVRKNIFNLFVRESET